MQDFNNRPSLGAQRQQRYRDRHRELSMPTNRQFDRVLREVVFESIDAPSASPVDLLSKTRTRLLTRFSYEGINAAIVKHSEGK